MGEGEEFEPGLEGFSDSGSDFYDLPAPELPDGVERTAVLRQTSGITLKRPETGDEVEIHYVASSASDDTALDSSRERNEPLRFVLGQGQVCQGLEMAVGTMRLGEQSRFRISPSLARGGTLSATATPAESAVVYEVELLNWVSCKDLRGDGSAIKRLLLRAEDKRRSKLGQECLLSLRLLPAASGTAEPLADLPALEHTIGGEGPGPRAAGAELSGRLLDDVLLSMRRGERASLHCAASVAFADLASLAAGLRPDSQVVFELQLLEFLDNTDISFERDGSVMKRSLRCRDAWAKCQDAGKCSLHVLSVKDSEAVLVGDRSLEFTIGNGEVCDVLECAAASMREGEEAIVTCSSAAVCEEPRLELSGRAGLAFHLRVESYEQGPGEVARHGGEKMKFYRSRKDRVKLEFYQSRKENATALFRAGRVRLAAYHFQQIYELLGYLDDYRGVKSGDAQKAQVAELKKSCLLNRSLCTLKDGNFAGTLAACDFVLDEQPQHAKALFRRARALLGLERCDEAMRDAKAALRVEPKNAEVQRLLVDIKARRKVDDCETRPMYAKMCSVLGSLPHPLDVD